MSTPAPPPASWAALPRLAKANVLALAAFAAVLSLVLWPSWRHDPDDSHGLFMPLVFIFLLHHSRAAGPRRFLQGGRGAIAATGALALAGLGLLFIGGLYAAAVGWSNALVTFLLATALSFLLGAALVSLADRRVRWMPFNWTACMAAGLWPLSAPIPPGTYTRLTACLQLWISEGVVNALHALGVVALRQGNVIRLASGSVGVEDACSGVRSLVSCIFVGFFFSAGLVSRPRARALIIALSAPLALGMNFIRSLGLTLLADSGVQIAGFWHDATGFAVLGVTAAILAGLALLLERGTGVPPVSSANTGADALVTPASQRMLAGALAVSSVLIAFFYFNTRPAADRGAPAPDLWALLPDSQPGWTVTASNDLYQFRDILQTDTLAQRKYQRAGRDGGLEVILYAAYWRPGQAPVSLVATHTPDACWPGSGWVPQSLPQSREALSVGGRHLPDAECRLFTSPRMPQYVWFWHLYDGKPIPYINPYSIGRLLRIAWLYGFRHDGDQLFVRVSSNRPWAEFADEPFLRQFMAGVRPLGL